MRASRRQATAGAILFLLGAALLPASGKEHKSAKHAGKGLAKATVLIIRHAEKPDDGPGLAPAGVARATAYVKYFQDYAASTKAGRLTALFAAATSGESARPCLTLRPLSQATGLPLDSQYKDKDYAGLVAALQAGGHGECILICWHHGEIPDLLRSLGADPGSLLPPDGKWPGEQYGWLIQLRFDKDGHLRDAQRIDENL